MESLFQVIERFSWLLFIPALFNILNLRQAVKDKAYTLLYPLIEAVFDVVLLSMCQYPLNDEFIVSSLYGYLFGNCYVSKIFSNDFPSIGFLGSCTQHHCGDKYEPCERPFWHFILSSSVSRYVINYQQNMFSSERCNSFIDNPIAFNYIGSYSANRSRGNLSLLSKLYNDLATFLIVALMYERYLSVCKPANYLVAIARRKRFVLKLFVKTQSLVLMFYLVYVVQYWFVYFADSISVPSYIPFIGPLTSLQRKCLAGELFVEYSSKYADINSGPSSYVVKAYDRIHLYVDLGQVSLKIVFTALSKYHVGSCNWKAETCNYKIFRISCATELFLGTTIFYFASE